MLLVREAVESLNETNETWYEIIDYSLVFQTFLFFIYILFPFVTGKLIWEIFAFVVHFLFFLRKVVSFLLLLVYKNMHCTSSFGKFMLFMSYVLF